MGQQLVVYISAPLTEGGEADFNTIHANLMQVAGVVQELAGRGFVPVCTHAYYLLLRRFGYEVQEGDRELWLGICQSLIDICDVVLRIGGESEGVMMETEYAMRTNKPVVYDIDELEKYRPLPN